MFTSENNVWLEKLGTALTAHYCVLCKFIRLLAYLALHRFCTNKLAGLSVFRVQVD